MVTAPLNEADNSPCGMRSGVHEWRASLRLGVRPLCLAVLFWLGANQSPASAQQDGEPDTSKARTHIGPLWLNPTFALTNLGVDSNVFNQPDDEQPTRDFTFTFTPQADVWVRLRGTWITLSFKEDLVWYQRYSSERARNDSYVLGWRVPFNRLSLSASGTWLSTRERPGFEIDARSERTEVDYAVKADYRAFGKTVFSATGGQKHVAFDKAAEFLGVNLHDELSRVETTGQATVRYQLTPYTTLAAGVAREGDRFPFDHLRDSNSTTITGIVTFDPAALVKGNATFGYRAFHPLVAGLADYDGGTFDVNLSYIAPDSTEVTLQAQRDVEYSFDGAQPYYLLTGFLASVTLHRFGPADVVGRYGAQRLAYADRVGAAVVVSNRVDHVRTFGLGVGYHVRRDVRFGVNIDHVSRSSERSDRLYSGLRVGTSVTYGL